MVFTQVMEQWTRSLPCRVTEGIMGAWPSGLHVFCGLGNPLRDSVGGCWGTMGYRSHFYKLSSPCITKARAVFVFLILSQTCLQCWLPKLPLVCDCHGQDLKVLSWRGGCLVWEPQDCISVFCGWCGSVGVFKPGPSAHTGAVHSWVWSNRNESQLFQIQVHDSQLKKGGMFWVSCSQVMAVWSKRWTDGLGLHQL